MAAEQTDQVVTLGNGVRFVQRSMPDTDSVTIHVTVRAGGRDEDLETEYGSSHFLEHLLFKRSEHFPGDHEVSEVIDAVGGQINAYTTEELTSFFAKLPKDHLELGLEVLADITQRPLWSSEELERERGVIIEEMNIFQDDPAQLIFDYVGGLLWPEARLRTTIYGTPESVAKLSVEDVSGYHRRFYVPTNTVVSIAGNSENARAQKLVERYFGAWRGGEAPRKPDPLGGLSPQKLHYQPAGTSQAHLVLAGRGAAIEAEDQAALQILCTILGASFSSRLNRRIREEQGLAYHLFMHSAGFLDVGKWQLYAGVSPENLAKATTSIMQILKEIRRQPVPEAELSKAREQLKARLIMSQETNGAVADRLGCEVALLGRVRSLREQLDEIEAVNVAAVGQAADRYLRPEDMRLALIAPDEAVDKAALGALLS